MWYIWTPSEYRIFWFWVFFGNVIIDNQVTSWFCFQIGNSEHNSALSFPLGTYALSKNLLYLNYLLNSKNSGMYSHITKCGFLKKVFNYECTFVSWPFPVITFGWVQQQNISVATENPPKSDDWKWSTDKSAFIIKWLLKKSIL